MKTILAHAGDGISTKKLVSDPFFLLDLPILLTGPFPRFSFAIHIFTYLIEASAIQEEKRKEGKRKKKRGGRVTESALIQNIEGPASGNITTAALSPIKLPPCNVVVFYSL